MQSCSVWADSTIAGFSERKSLGQYGGEKMMAEEQVVF
jgi:hypothetical protein